MQDRTRRAAAYLAGRLISSKDSTAVYDYQKCAYFSFSGSVDIHSFNFYDHAERCHIYGNGGSSYNAYHTGNRQHFSLTVNGSSFSGYDYDSKSHFSGTVNNSTVSVHDNEHAKYFTYSI